MDYAGVPAVWVVEGNSFSGDRKLCVACDVDGWQGKVGRFCGRRVQWFKAGTACDIDSPAWGANFTGDSNKFPRHPDCCASIGEDFRSSLEVQNSNGLGLRLGEAVVISYGG